MTVPEQPIPEQPIPEQLVQPELSVIVPVLNEAAVLPALLTQLKQQQGIAVQIVVADGGSSDSSVAIAEAAGATVLRTAAGRATQMNAGAAIADAEHVLFLHADSGLPDTQLLRRALDALLAEQHGADSQPVAGHFALRFIGEHSGQQHTPPFGYRYLQTKTALNRENTTNGDQGLLISRADFNAQGGFDDSLPFLEDQRVAEQLRREGRWITLPARLDTAARRFESEGFVRRYTLMSIMMGLFAIGAMQFFRRAGDVYRHQQDTRRLQLAPFLSVAWSVLLELSWRERIALGRYVARNAWQFALMCDVWRDRSLGTGAPEPAAPPTLRFYDEYLAWFFNSRVVGAITFALVVIWFFGILWPTFALIDRNRS